MFCDRPEADPKRGCPDCLVTTLVGELKEDCEIAFADLAENRDRKKNHSWPWTFSKLQQDVSIVSNIDASVNGEGYNGEWTVRMKTLVSILRDERYKAQKARLQEITNRGRRNESE